MKSQYISYAPFTSFCTTKYLSRNCVVVKVSFFQKVHIMLLVFKHCTVPEHFSVHRDSKMLHKIGDLQSNKYVISSEKNLPSRANKVRIKGQLISKCPFGFIVWAKIPTKLFLDFCPEFFFVASWGLHGSSLGFLGT